jgi:hypothetical protein
MFLCSEGEVEHMEKYRIAVYAERIVKGRIYLKTKADNPEDAKRRVENYLIKAGYDLELSPEEFVSETEQDPEYRISHILDVEETEEGEEFA